MSPVPWAQPQLVAVDPLPEVQGPRGGAVTLRQLADNLLTLALEAEAMAGASGAPTPKKRRYPVTVKGVLAANQGRWMTLEEIAALLPHWTPHQVRSSIGGLVTQGVVDRSYDKDRGIAVFRAGQGSHNDAA